MAHSVFSLPETSRKQIEEKVAYKRNLARLKEEALFQVFDEKLNDEERWALNFLYANMPLNDLADYNGAFFLRHVRNMLDIRAHVPWGTVVSDKMFLHYVLPYRINNENIENDRGILFNELFPRTKHCSMKEAIREVNYWCYEKATYTGNDARTVSPLTLMRNTLGRCGEQSTLAVAALRSIGIPARQVYVPLWSHTDSNHAWVEAWADGKWYFFGACEPDVQLNKGWFDKPATRAMLVHTRVPATYDGPETVTVQNTWHTEINILENYAPQQNVTFRVTNTDGNPVADATVYVQVYNFGGFRTIASLQTDQNGQTQFVTGSGDVLLHAVKDGSWGMRKARIENDTTFAVMLRFTKQPNKSMELDIVPPQERQPEHRADPVSENMQQVHQQQMNKALTIRKNYEETFITKSQAHQVAIDLELPTDRVWHVLQDARGNSHEIVSFLTSHTPSQAKWALALLESIKPKDLTDTSRDALDDHLYGSLSFGDMAEELFTQYVLSPRINIEMIGPYKQYFQSIFSVEEQRQFHWQPNKLVNWVQEHIDIVENANYYRGVATPVGTFQLRKATAPSRDVLFVAMARSFGIAARLEPNFHNPQYYSDTRQKWVDVFWDAEAEKCVRQERGTVRFIPSETAEEVQYLQNMSMARLSNGMYETVRLPRLKQIHTDPIELQAGSYRLTTGKRLNDGSVLARFEFFTVKPEEEVRVPLVFRKENRSLPVLGRTDEHIAIRLPNKEKVEVSSIIAKGPAVFAWIEPDQEPSRHVLRELDEISETMSERQTPVYFIIDEQKWRRVEDIHEIRDLPLQIQLGIDTNNETFGRFVRAIREEKYTTMDQRLPAVFIMDDQQQIRYLSTGYKLGIGNEVVDVLKRLYSCHKEGKKW